MKKVWRRRNWASATNNYKNQKQERVEEFGLSIDFWKYRPGDPTIGRFGQIDPVASDYPYNSPYTFQENKCGLGVELEGAELREFANWVDNMLGQVLSYTDVDDITVLTTTITRDGAAIHTDGTAATSSDKAFAAGGLLLPLASGSLVKKVLDKAGERLLTLLKTELN